VKRFLSEKKNTPVPLKEKEQTDYLKKKRGELYVRQGPLLQEPECKRGLGAR